jgi:hypothetical protein
LTEPLNISPKTNLYAKLRSSLKSILWVLGISSVLNLIGYWIHLTMGTPFETIYLDPVPELGGDFSIGMLSQVGIMLWSAAGAVFLLGGYLIRNNGRQSSWMLFLIASGILSLLMGLDDSLLIHEQIMPVFLGIKEKPVFTVYGLAILIYYLWFFRIIVETDLILLGLTLFSFGLSLGIDLLPHELHAQVAAFEDVPKLAGIVAWLVYAIKTSSMAVLEKTQSAENLEVTNG